MILEKQNNERSNALSIRNLNLSVNIELSGKKFKN
jgi:hypothetical protein